MGLFSSVDLVSKRADEVQVGDHLASGLHQSFALGNAKSGELVMKVETEGGLVYIMGDRAPGYAWTCSPEEIVMIEKEK